jgi:acyl dehydratase
MSTPLLYLEDLAVGQTLQSGTHTLDAEQIKAFAAQFDPQPFHLDEQAAKATFFGGLAASGWHVAAVTMRLLTETTSIAGGLIGAGAEVNWPRPTRPGDTLRLVVEVVEIVPSRSRPERGMALVRCNTFNQLDEIVQTMSARLVVPRRTVPETEIEK